MELMIKSGFYKEKYKDKNYKSYQNINTPFIIFFVQSNIFSVTKDHNDNKCNYKKTCEDQLSGRKHFSYFYAKLTF